MGSGLDYGLWAIDQISKRSPGEQLWHGRCCAQSGGQGHGKALAAWLMVAGAIAASATGPRKTVEAAVMSVVAVLQQSEVAQSKRAAEIKRITRGLFDFDEIASRVLSRHWAGRTPEERSEFVGFFTDLLERSYLNRIEANAGERIVYTAEVIDRIYATVRSKVIKMIASRLSEVRLDYRMRLRNNRWQVYDVTIDGISFVSTYRFQFDRIIQAESYGALVERLRKRDLDTAAIERKRR
jgi:phospholipid transport system substrate-binding protein